MGISLLLPAFSNACQVGHREVRLRISRWVPAGAPVGDILRTFDGFAASYDTRLRNPRWVLERLTKESSKGSGNRAQAAFQEDPAINSKFRAKLIDFQGSGYDRGHMAPAANHKGSQDKMADTFVLTNISPQVGKGFNRYTYFHSGADCSCSACQALHSVLSSIALTYHALMCRDYW